MFLFKLRRRGGGWGREMGGYLPIMRLSGSFNLKLPHPVRSFNNRKLLLKHPAMMFKCHVTKTKPFQIYPGVIFPDRP
jgi:hypothetical protein